MCPDWKQCSGGAGGCTAQPPISLFWEAELPPGWESSCFNYRGKVRSTEFSGHREPEAAARPRGYACSIVLLTHLGETSCHPCFRRWVYSRHNSASTHRMDFPLSKMDVLTFSSPELESWLPLCLLHATVSERASNLHGPFALTPLWAQHCLLHTLRRPQPGGWCLCDSVQCVSTLKNYTSSPLFSPLSFHIPHTREWIFWFDRLWR